MKRTREDELPQKKRNKVREADHQLSSEQSVFADGEWVRGSMLGEGGFGSVYMALLNKECGSQFKNCPQVMAVKSAYGSASVQLATEKVFLDRFSDSPYIIRCFGDDVTITDDGETVYNVFLEFASGGTLADMIIKVKEALGVLLDESIVREHTRSILLGLKRIHEEGLVHCDLKLENILLVRQGKDFCGAPNFVAKIADLGLTKMVGERSVRGTRSYWSPEIVRDEIQGQPSDIWALGCIVFGMLIGELPWHYWRGLEKGEVLVFPSCLSTEAKDFLKKCFHGKPEQRPTAGMLLRHPFVCGLIENEEDGRQCVFSSTSFSADEDSNVVSVIPISSG